MVARWAHIRRMADADSSSSILEKETLSQKIYRGLEQLVARWAHIRRMADADSSSSILEKETLSQKIYRGVEQLVARWAHNPKVAGSSPASATQSKVVRFSGRPFLVLQPQIPCSPFMSYTPRRTTKSISVTPLI